LTAQAPTTPPNGVPRRASVIDVARLAEVSVGTVSNVLNRPERVAAATRSRVEAAIEQLNFVPNSAARQLRVGAAKMVGSIVLDLANPFFMEVARGLQDRLELDDWALMLAASDGSPEREAQFLRMFEQHGVGGVAVVPSQDRIDELAALAERGVPVVLMDLASPVPEISSVAVDDVAGGRMAAQHLLSMGHERIAMLNGPHTVHQCRDRREGVTSALRAAGLDPAVAFHELTVPMNARGGELGANALLSQQAGQRATAVVCVNDMVALGALRTVRLAGLDVPGDLAIVGYDDVAFAGELLVPLSSVRRPSHTLGSTAADLLLRPPGQEAVQVVYPPQLVVRASTAG